MNHQLQWHNICFSMEKGGVGLMRWANRSADAIAVVSTSFWWVVDSIDNALICEDKVAAGSVRAEGPVVAIGDKNVPLRTINFLNFSLDLRYCIL